MTTRDELTRAQVVLDDAIRELGRAQAARDELILRGRSEGMTVGDLSKAMGVTRSRIHQVLTRIRNQRQGIDGGM